MPPPSSAARPAKRLRLEQSQSSRHATNTNNNLGESTEDQLDGRKYYNPDQDPEERQALKRESRALEREFNGA